MYEISTGPLILANGSCLLVETVHTDRRFDMSKEEKRIKRVNLTFLIPASGLALYVINSNINSRLLQFGSAVMLSMGSLLMILSLFEEFQMEEGL